jgi:Ca2+-binding EF-hand superfamily protein
MTSTRWRPIVTKKILLCAILAAAATPVLAQASAPAQPQPITRTSFMQKIDSAFTGVDTNKDGFTDRAEIEAAEAKALAARKTVVLKERERAFQRLDSNKDGLLSLAEFNAIIAAQALPKANATPLLNKLDTNKDGKISLSENRAPAMAQFDRADTNKDGTISAAEQKALVKR